MYDCMKTTKSVRQFADYQNVRLYDCNQMRSVVREFEPSVVHFLTFRRGPSLLVERLAIWRSSDCQNVRQYDGTTVRRSGRYHRNKRHH